eukprot:3072795-Prymnesium_polylepis.1
MVCVAGLASRALVSVVVPCAASGALQCRQRDESGVKVDAARRASTFTKVESTNGSSSVP